MKAILKSVLGATFAAALFVFAQPALAGTPVLSISSIGTVNNYTVTVSGANANSALTIFQKPNNSSVWSTITGFTTDSSGFFSQVLNLGISTYSVPVDHYVLVGGLQSNTVTLNTSGCTNCNNNLSFSQNSVTLNVGQTSTVNVFSSFSTSYFLSSNSNPGVANAFVNGSAISIQGQSNGSTNLTVCTTNSTACGTIFVSVSGSNFSNISFTPSSLNMTVGQSLFVNINSSTFGGSYYISGNSNSAVASASISGNGMTVYGQSSGNATITVCQNNNSACATLPVFVTGSCFGSNCYNNNLSLSQTNVNLSIGQSQTVTAYNSFAGALYISSNSNPTVASVSISGSNINFYGLANGSSTVMICANNAGQCASVYVNVGGYYGGGNISFSQSSLTMGVSQSSTIAIYGSGGYYLSTNSNPGVVSASISGNTIYLNSLSTGSSTLTVCQNLGSNTCGSVYVTVNSFGGGSALWFSQNTVNLSGSQSQSVTIYSNNYGGPYYLSSNSNPGAVSANVVGNSLNLTAQNSGTSTITVCQSSGSSNCSSIAVTVNGFYGGSSISLSQTSLNLNVGQSSAISIYGSGNYYVSNTGNTAVASANIVGSVLNVYAGQNGTSTISICQSTTSSCASLYVTVGSGNVLGASLYGNGTLISEGGTVYIVYKNTKTGFASEAAFTGLGFKFSNVVPAVASGLNNSGYVVVNAFGAHPWGSWIKSGSTIYFVHQSGLIPISDWNIFLNNGGQANLVVPANFQDLALPQLSVMVLNDSRLR